MGLDMKRITLECGGNDAAIVRADADVKVFGFMSFLILTSILIRFESDFFGHTLVIKIKLLR